MGGYEVLFLNRIVINANLFVKKINQIHIINICNFKKTINYIPTVSIPTVSIYYYFMKMLTDILIVRIFYYFISLTGFLLSPYISYRDSYKIVLFSGEDNAYRGY